MSRERLIVLGVVVLGALSFLVYSQAKRDAVEGRPTVVAADLPTVAATGDIDKISISNAGKPAVILQKVPGAASPDGGVTSKWELASPVKADANQQAVNDLVNNLKELKVDSKVNLKLDDDERKEKQLDAAHGVHVIAWRGADPAIDEIFGKSGAAGELLVVTSKPNDVWAVKGYSSYLYTKEAKDFRDKDVLHFDDADAVEATLTNSHGTTLFTKASGKWTATLDKRAIPRFDGDKVSDMLRAYKALSADDFGDGKSLADTGLDKPEATVSITLKSASKPVELLLGKIATGTSRWGKRPDSDTIYQIPGFAADWAVSDSSKYQATADAGAKSAPKSVSKK